MRIDACHDALTGCFLVASSAVDLSGKEQVTDEFGLQCLVQLRRVEIIVFDSVTRAIHHTMFQALHAVQRFELYLPGHR